MDILFLRCVAVIMIMRLVRGLFTVFMMFDSYLVLALSKRLPKLQRKDAALNEYERLIQA